MRSAASRDRWLLSYADFITLLFAFFTVLYASASLDPARWAELEGRAVESKPSVLPANRGVVDAGAESNVDDVRSQLEHELGDVLKTREVEMTTDRRGLVLSVPEAGAFPVGGADLSAGANEFMLRLSRVLLRVPNGVRIEGHTDDTPIHTARFASNWELSTARATAVVQYLITQGSLAPDRLSAAGYGEFHPRGPNADAASRARNRRVDIIILNETP